MGYTICICDDDSKIRNDLKRHILQYSFEHNVDFSTFEIEAAPDLLSCKEHYDILFLDIRYGKQDIGINIAETLRKQGNSSILAIITSYDSMAIDGYRAEPFRFIVKPFTEQQIFKLLDDCCCKLAQTMSYIKITSDFLSEMIRVEKILYIYSKARKRYVVCDDCELSTWQTLQELMDNLPNDRFAYVQKSFIVNLNMVDTIRNDSILLSNKKLVPIGNHYKDDFMKKLQINIKMR